MPKILFTPYLEVFVRHSNKTYVDCCFLCNHSVMKKKSKPVLEFSFCQYFIKPKIYKSIHVRIINLIIV